MSIRVHMFAETADYLGSNSYLIIYDNNDAILVDPSFFNKRILKYIKENDLNLIACLLTHGHYDHIQGLPVILKKYQRLPVYIGQADVVQLVDPNLNLSGMSKDKREHLSIKHPIKGVIEGPLDIKGHVIQVLDTPFHTCGSVCYLIPEEHIMFTGDTLMKGEIGRFDLKHASPRNCKASLQKLGAQDPEYKIYSGHGEVSTIREELKNNQFLIRFSEGNK